MIRFQALVLAAVAHRSTAVLAANTTTNEYTAKSGIRTWVDPDTPADRQTYTSSRGRRWELVMSDEFNLQDRDFRPGKDHLWTSIEKPDGVNGALEIYSHNMTSTACSSDGTCYFYIKAMDEHTVVTVYNQYLSTPGYEHVDFYYRAAMVQSWNKFCFQGGMLEVRAQLPGAVSSASGNPDLGGGATAKTSDNDYYPTWPGIWMMGNLGRAIFSASTNRMWPFSYDRCEPEVFNATKNQRINACDGNPGYGLNPHQGRGAPEIDLLEGGGVAISSSLQIGPGMPSDFRLFPVDEAVDKDNAYCLYSAACLTQGANHPGVPTALYDTRGHKSWYQGLRYASNPFCAADAKQQQDYTTVATSVSKGITQNTCTLATCPASLDVYADLALIDGSGSDHWGINTNGTCFPVMNAYMGAFLCDPDNQNTLCPSPRPDSQAKTNTMREFGYQMDAISSNWPVHFGAYSDYLVYQLEWVTGSSGYVRWMLDGHSIFEVTADAFENVPQDAASSNPRKIMLEEPMYLIFNVALSSSWGAHPIYTDSVCRGDGTNAKATRICDEYPMYLKIDYIRLYQDLADDLDPGSYMQVGCDPASHPTKQWIEGHIDEYQDEDNQWVEVAGGAMCTVDDDCTIGPTETTSFSGVITGNCVDKRCVCSYKKSWGGPRCSTALTGSTSDSSSSLTELEGFGPPFEVAIGLALLVVLLTSLSAWLGYRESVASYEKHAARLALTKKVGSMSTQSPTDTGHTQLGTTSSRADYRHNFV